MVSQPNVQQFSEEMKAAWDVVEQQFAKEDILGPVVADVITKHAVRASQHELPYAMSMMAGCISMANGGGSAYSPTTHRRS